MCDNELEKYPIKLDWVEHNNQHRQIDSLSDKLVCHNTRPVITKHSIGIPNRLCGNATPRVTTNSSSLYLGAGHTNTEGNIQTSSEAGNTSCGVTLGEGLLLQHISGPQKGWGTETCHQPQSTKQFCAPGALKDGGNQHPQRPVETGEGNWLTKVYLKDA